MLLHLIWILRWDVSKDAQEQNVGDVQFVAEKSPIEDFLRISYIVLYTINKYLLKYNST